MYSLFRGVSETLLRIPPDPEPPPGDEVSARIFRAAPRYLLYLRVLWAIRNAVKLLAVIIPFTIVVTTVAADLQGDSAFVVLLVGGLILGIFVMQALVSLALVQLDFDKRWYIVTDRSLRIREGITTVREITFTFANIQNLSVSQGPVQRLLGIADLKVETAGGGRVAGQQQHPGLNLHTAYFRGIQNAEEVKQLVAERMRGRRDSGLGDHDDSHHPQALENPAIPQQSVSQALRAVLEEASALRRSVEHWV
jgi:uncharacterized membrane protein YdbT with pleckstrin-like domain